MKYTLISSAALAFLLTWFQATTAEDLASQLVGVWKWNSHMLKEVATGKVTYPFGENPPAISSTRRADTLFSPLQVTTAKRL